MKDIDRMIEEALDGEEQALFRETAREPDFSPRPSACSAAATAGSTA